MATEIQEPQQQPDHQTLEIPTPTDDQTHKVEDMKETTPSATTISEVTEDSGSATDLQKRIRRAERFGVTVQLSEEEKMDNRAERFGTAPTSRGSVELKKSEERKRKARAERFGLPAQSVTDEEAKRKARLARFAPSSKVSTAEEDKMKARAARFAKTPTGTSSQVNGKTNSVEEKGNAGTISDPA